MQIKHVMLFFVTVSSNHVSHVNHGDGVLKLHGEQQIDVVSWTFCTQKELQNIHYPMNAAPRNPTTRTATYISENFVKFIRVFVYTLLNSKDNIKFGAFFDDPKTYSFCCLLL